MDITTSVSLPGIILVSTLLSACCQQQPSAHNSGQPRASSGNCHTHNDNTRATMRHCHAYSDPHHKHNYGGGSVRKQVVKPQPQYQARPSYDYPSYYDTKKKGYYRGEVDSVLDPYAKNVLRDYRNY